VYLLLSAAVGEPEEGRKCAVRAWSLEVGGDIFFRGLSMRGMSPRL